MPDQETWNRLLDKAKDDHLSKHELDQVVAAIKDPKVIGDPYTLLHIIGRSMDTSHEDLVARYLNCRKDPMLARLALQILCSYWDKTEKYLDYVREFLRGVDWDDEEDVRQIAISIAGEYLRGRWDEELFQQLLDVATNDHDLSAIRVTAIRALGRALGDNWTEFPPITTRSDPDDEWYRSTLERAFQRFVDRK